jgi:hypothetical protein
LVVRTSIFEYPFQDEILVFFNDPVPIPDSAERAINMAVAMRAAASTLIGAWRRRGRKRVVSRRNGTSPLRAWLDTFSFQAPEFYPKFGYREFGRLDYPPLGTRGPSPRLESQRGRAPRECRATSLSGARWDIGH